jgi:hypothetical protein
MDRSRFTATTLLITGALLIWALQFASSYVLVAIACARGFAHARILGLRMLPSMLTVMTIVSLIAVTVLIAHARRRARLECGPSVVPFASSMAVACAALAVVAIAMTGLVAVLTFAQC